jgi:hypothetical protein
MGFFKGEAAQVTYTHVSKCKVKKKKKNPTEILPMVQMAQQKKRKKCQLLNAYTTYYMCYFQNQPPIFIFMIKTTE